MGGRTRYAYSVTSQITFIDTIVILVYLVGIMAVGILAGYKKNASSEEFFLGGRSLKWPIIGTGLFCANISSIHLVGLASAGYQHGLVIGNFAWMASFELDGDRTYED